MSEQPKAKDGKFTLGALSKPRHIRTSMAKVLRLGASGEIDSEHMARLCRGLRQLYDVLMGVELEARVRALEERDGR